MNRDAPTITCLRLMNANGAEMSSNLRHRGKIAATIPVRRRIMGEKIRRFRWFRICKTCNGIPLRGSTQCRHCGAEGKFAEKKQFKMVHVKITNYEYRAGRHPYNYVPKV